MSENRIVDLLDVTYDYAAQAGVLLLREAEGAGRTLAIPVALGDAQQIWRAARGDVRSRPGTHELTVGILALTGVQLVSVVVTKREEGVYFAEIHLMSSNGPQLLDARPSDAVTLALRHTPRTPLLVADTLLAEASL